jgi:hypothetical protein
MMLDSGPAEHRPGAGAAGAAQEQPTPATIVNRVPFSGGRKLTPRSVRIVSMQDPNVVSATTPTGAGNGGRAGAGAGGRREPGTAESTTMPVSSSIGASLLSPFPISSSFFSRAAIASVIGAPSQTLFYSSQTPDAPLRAAKVPSPCLRLELLRDSSWKMRIHFYLFPVLVLAHVPLQTFLDFINAIYFLIE